MKVKMKQIAKMEFVHYKNIEKNEKNVTLMDL